MIKIIIPYSESDKWIAKCIESVKSQSVENWLCYLIDDISSDNSNNIIDSMVDDRFIKIRNDNKQYQCWSYNRLIKSKEFKEDDICVSLDADDWFYDINVLERVKREYDRGVWLTWGNHIWTDGSPSICGEIDNTENIRKEVWRTSHLRTWKAFLWKMIDDNDLLGPDNEILKVAGDMATMIPMIEMAGIDRIKFIKEINYVYNRSNEYSNFRIRSTEQTRNGTFIRSKKPYSKL